MKDRTAKQSKCVCGNPKPKTYVICRECFEKKSKDDQSAIKMAREITRRDMMVRETKGWKGGKGK